MRDKYNRQIDYMRISVTDRCNLRCIYCMPDPKGVPHIPHEEILSFEEIGRIVRLAADLGIRKIKLTGGEPLVRKDIVALVEKLHSTPGIEEVTMTTNGVLFAPLAAQLHKAGLSSVNFSLDSLQEDSFRQITQSDSFSQVHRGIEAALSLPFKRVKVNCVPLREYNLSQIIPIASLAKEYPIAVRFIEMMPIGYGKTFQTIPNEEILAMVESHFGTLTKTDVSFGNGPAVYCSSEELRGSIGFISAVSHMFCESCNRIRLTSDGVLKQCLHSGEGTNLKRRMRSGITDQRLLTLMAEKIYNKPLHHHFGEGEYAYQFEQRNMVQIGG